MGLNSFVLVITQVSLSAPVSCNFSFDRQCPVTKEPNNHSPTHPAPGCGTRPLHLSLPHSQVTIPQRSRLQGSLATPVSGLSAKDQRCRPIAPSLPAPGPPCPCALCPRAPSPAPLLCLWCSAPLSQGCRSVPAGITGTGQGTPLLPPRQEDVAAQGWAKEAYGDIHLRQGLFWALSRR